MAPPNPYRHAIAGLALIAAAAVLIELGLLLFDRSSRAAPVVALVSLLVGLAALAGLVALVPFARARAAATARLIDGGYLARWRYETGEWERFIAQEHRRNRQILGRAMLLLVGALLLVGIFYLLPGPSPQITDVIWLLFLGVALLVALAYNVGSPTTYARRQGKTDETYIGAQGAYRPNGYLALYTRMRTLQYVTVRAGDPAVLVFVFRQMLITFPNPFPTRITTEIRLPIPFAHEDEARTLASGFPRAG
jgi:hypothetical protein